MKKACITGARGTVGRVLHRHLAEQKTNVVGWDRQALGVDDPVKMGAFLDETRPDVLFHLAIASQGTGRPNEGWVVNVEWPSVLARLTRERDIRFVFTSTAMVFSDDAIGPFTASSIPDASAGYGFEKLRAEEQVRLHNPDSVIVRLGWQIGDKTTGNNMFAALHQQMQDQGVIRASTRWYPACSMLDDTALALMRLATAPADTYMLDSNRHWTFFQIAKAIGDLRKTNFTVEPNSDFVFDQRLLDPRPDMPSLSTRLPTLR